MQKISKNLRLLTNLLNDLNYHQLEEIATRCSLKPSAVKRLIQKLENFGAPFNYHKTKGYKLADKLVLLNKDAIHLDSKVGKLYLLASIPSTNDYLKDQGEFDLSKVCLSEHQSLGKGRLARSWHSPFGQNIYLSYGYPFQGNVSSLLGLSIVVSLAVVEALKAAGFADEFTIKWPNDILYQGKKLVGNLIETISHAPNATYAVIGIGINVNMQDATAIEQAWCSLRQISGSYIDRNPLVSPIIKTLTDYLAKFQTSGLSPFLPLWSNHDFLFNKTIKIISEGKPITGLAKGINSQGNLLIELASGELVTINAGDATIDKD
jgi:BirA family biotin operon repressor/biotin-[acetyl-CoA-carboxylase] ligase